MQAASMCTHTQTHTYTPTHTPLLCQAQCDVCDAQWGLGLKKDSHKSSKRAWKDFTPESNCTQAHRERLSSSFNPSTRAVNRRHQHALASCTHCPLPQLKQLPPETGAKGSPLCSHLRLVHPFLPPLLTMIFHSPASLPAWPSTPASLSVGWQ